MLVVLALILQHAITVIIITIVFIGHLNLRSTLFSWGAVSDWYATMNTVLVA